MKEQVVVINDGQGYGIAAYYDEEKIDFLEFDFSSYEDEYPEEWQLKKFRKLLESVTNVDARSRVEGWLEENDKWAETEAENNKWREEQRQEEIDAAMATLAKYGVPHG